MTLKKWLTTGIMAALVLSLAACGEKDNANQDPAPAPTPAPDQTEVTDLILSTTTSTQDSGLLDVLIPLFEEAYPYNVQTIAVGTGAALEMATKGEADVLLTHAPSSEKEKEEAGDVTNRHRVMYNDFIILGPTSDPAGINGLSINEAFAKLLESNATFVSRGDDSGTHKKELQIWEAAGLDPKTNSNYVEAATGMGATLQVAYEKDGYVLTDRATYLAQKDNFPEFTIAVEGDKELLNIYHVMQVNPEKNDQINADGAEAFVNFMIADETQAVIADFGKAEYGESLFFPYTEDK